MPFDVKPPDLSFLYRESGGHHRTGPRERIERARSDIWRSADDFEQRAAPVIHFI